MAEQYIFERVEKKYKITGRQKEQLFSIIGHRIKPDVYGEATICNLYFDNDRFELVRTSIEKPFYKEKLRLRSYGTPEENDTVFLELKKKYKGIVYKRREKLTLREAESYVETWEKPKESQIINEIQWVRSYYGNLSPKMYLAYDRRAYVGAENQSLRITFDSNIRYRQNDLYLEHGTDGRKLLPDDVYIMEVKVTGALPLWLIKGFETCGIYPASFSKYGTAYMQVLREEGFEKLSRSKNQCRNIVWEEKQAYVGAEAF